MYPETIYLHSALSNYGILKKPKAHLMAQAIR